MNALHAEVIVEISSIFDIKELGNPSEISIHLGEVSKTVPLSIVREHFEEIEVYFTYSDDTIARLKCKTTKSSKITFTLNVKTEELQRVEKQTTEFKIPQDRLGPIPVE